MQNGSVFADAYMLASLIGAKITETNKGAVIEKGIHRLKINAYSAFADYNDKMVITNGAFFKKNILYADAAAVCGYMDAEFEFDGDKAIYITKNDTYYLVNTVNKIKNNQTVKIAFSGGAAASGKGAGEEASSYRSLLMSMLKNYYSETEFEEINGTIGITGSDLELFRVDKITKHCPDLIIIDFCAEDSKRSYDDIVKYLEWLICEIKKTSADTDIVLLETWSEGLNESCENDETFYVTEAYAYIAEKYDIPFLNIGEELYNSAVEEGLSVQDMYMRYLYYPNDAGHSFYAGRIFELFKEAVFKSVEPSLYEHRPADMPQSVMHGFTVNADNAIKTGFNVIEEKIKGKTYSALCAETGAELEFNFIGSAIGITWIIGIDTGSIEYSIDDGQTHTLYAFDELGTREYRQAYKILADNLDSKEHTLKIRVGEKRAPKSLGSKIMIEEFLVGVFTEP